MAPRRVVHDSDDEDGALSPDTSPEKAPGGGIEKSEGTHLSAVQQSGGVIGTSSTDPSFFQAIYEEQRAGFMAPIDSNSTDAIPILEDPITTQRISSSPVTGRSFTRKVPIETSSITFISEPSASNRRMKRAKSVMALKELTQVTTPAESKDILTQATAHLETDPSPSKDLWEFPGSSSGQYPVSSVVKSRNALKNSEAMKRNKTMSAVSSRPAYNKPPVMSLDDSDAPINRKRSSRSKGDEDLLEILPRAKRHKRGISVNAEILTKTHVVSQISLVMPSDPLDLVAAPNTSHTSILIPRSATQELQNSAELPAPKKCEKSDLITTSCDSIVKQTYSADNRSSTTEDITTSLMIIPNPLTDSQKREYNVITVSSSNPGPESSMPDLVQLVNSREPAKHFADTTTNTITYTPSKHSQTLDMVPTRSSKTEKPTSNWKIKRSKTDTASVARPLTTPTSSGKTKAPTRRSRSMTQKQQQLSREMSADELSLDFSECVESIVLDQATKSKNKRAAEQPIFIDGPCGSAEIEVLKEHVQPQPSLRRSKSISIQATDSKIQADLSPRRRGRPRNKTAISVVESPASPTEAVAYENTEIGHMGKEFMNSLDDHSAEVIENHLDDALPYSLAGLETASVARDEPSLPKKRGRKKDLGKAVDQQKDSTSTVPPVNEAPTALQELDINPQPQEPTTPSWNRTADFILTKTPTDINNAPPQVKTPVRVPQKAPDQHSPLASGKVPYRVGLSRKTRIAPLLKMIRKDS